MNLKGWARATHRALASQPAAERHNLPTTAQVEKVLRMSVATLIEALTDSDYLQIDAFGRIWTEERASYQGMSNLEAGPQQYHKSARKVVRFRASSRLTSKVNTVREDADS